MATLGLLKIPRFFYVKS